LLLSLVETIKTIEKYENQFKNLKVANAKKNKYNADGAPHKPILLLSLIKLYEKGKLDLSNIDPEIVLTRNSDLKAFSKELWRDLGYERRFNFALPFYYLKDEDFWKMKLRNDFLSPIPKDKNNPSLKNLKERIEKVYLENELIELLENKKHRKRLIKALLSGKKVKWFNERDKKIVKQKMDL